MGKDNEFFKPTSKKLFIGTKNTKNPSTDFYTLHCYPSDDTRINEAHIWEEDFFFIMLAFGTVIDRKGFDPYDCYSLNKQNWLKLLKETQKLVNFNTFEDMYRYVSDAGAEMDSDLKYDLNNNQKYFWDDRKEIQLMLEDLEKWTEFVMKEGDEIEILGL